jgi:hypothetical protein
MDEAAVRARLRAVRDVDDQSFDDEELRARLARLQGRPVYDGSAGVLPPRAIDAYLQPPRPSAPEDEVEELLRANADQVCAKRV